MKNLLIKSCSCTTILFYIFCGSYVLADFNDTESTEAIEELMQNDPAAAAIGPESDKEDVVIDSRFGGAAGVLPSYSRKMSHSYGKTNPVKTTELKVTKVGKHCDQLKAPVNSNAYCASLNFCRVTCFGGYALPYGETVANYSCTNGQWINKKTNSNRIENCQAVCNPPCSRNGLCILPDVCQCFPNFYGRFCENEKIPCIGYPPTPASSSKRCNPESCTINCVNGRKFPDGSDQVNMYCKNGKWIPDKANWTEIPNCSPVCNPACRNGGKCIDTNKCMCPSDFRGPLCQYSINECDVSKLNFNGGYNCSGDGNSFSCKLSCSDSMEPDGELAPIYTCLYSEGVFKPVNIPQCKISLPFSPPKTEIIDKEQIIFQYKAKPAPSTCLLWGAFNYKTFDGNVFSFKSQCTFVLVSDEENHLFHIHVSFGNDTIQKIIIYIENEEYILYKNEKNLPVLLLEKTQEVLSVPSQLPDLKVEIASGKSVMVFIPLSNVYIFWNLQSNLRVDVGENLWNKTGGLCGHYRNGRSYRNIEKFASEWLINFDTCTRQIDEVKTCTEAELIKAEDYCKALKYNDIFSECQFILPVNEYAKACEQAYCAAAASEREEVMCQFISMFVKSCSVSLPGLKINWRDPFNCTIKCPETENYTACMAISQPTCVSDEVKPNVIEKYCEEGCVCPSGTALHEDKCIRKDQCPCIFRSQFYSPGHVIQKDCNQCTCMGGKWSCTNAVCKGVCTVIGDSHYKTFDGKKYNFFGKCSYSLVVLGDVNIEVDNSACSGLFLGNAGSYDTVEKTTCSKSVKIHIGDKFTIKLRPSHGISVNSKEVEKLPYYKEKEFYIRKSSSYLIQVSLSIGLDVFWDGTKKLIVTAIPSLQDKTKGLCGTFNRNQKDDLLTPEGDIEQDLQSFANKWKSKELCDKPDVQIPDPCEVNVQNKFLANQYCSNITGTLFSDCHSDVDPKSYYEECMFDMCSCQDNKISSCLCPVVSSYAEECARHGIALDWRKYIRECGIHCSGGQKYELCGNSCQRSCADISRREVCKENCYEGCYCPLGYTFNDKEECIPISECPCISNGRQYPADYVEVHENGTVPKVCKCRNAVYECWETTVDKVEKYRHEHNETCNEIPNTVFSHCEPAEPITCKNMNSFQQSTPAACHAGCICKEGYVLDSILKSCVKPSECPCHHGGRSYRDGESMKEECNTCKCSKGKWECTTKECSGVCSSWGDTHFQTFDGKFYDFQGTCDYMFAKGSLSESDSFNVVIEIVPCGTGGTSCAKSVKLNVVTDDVSESVTFIKENELPNTSFKKMFVYEVGLYVTVVVPTLSITLQWDKGTRIGLQIDPKWRKKLSGLCGNFDGDVSNDFQTPSGGLIEVSPVLFADSWKLQHHCPVPPPLTDPCVLHPFRKVWAVEKCNLLKDSPVFKLCHSEVPIDEYISRCIFDSCACDQGGDCECICTVFAAYGQECAARGVPIKWRQLRNCPIQCEHETEYCANITACPEKSCDNLMDYEKNYGLCHQLPVVEGCYKKPCPPGYVLQNSSSTECVSVHTCPCMNVSGVIYYENDVLEEDDCHRCTCSNGKKVCTGLPCTPTPIPTMPASVSTPPSCINGWTKWIKLTEVLPDGWSVADYAISAYNTDVPANETISSGSICELPFMANISCRQKGKNSSFKTVPCDIDEGLECIGSCEEFEFQILCNCNVPRITTYQHATNVSKVTCAPYSTSWLNASNPLTGLYDKPFTEKLKSEICREGYHIKEISCTYLKLEKRPKKQPSKSKLRPKKQSSSWINWNMTDDIDVVCNSDVGLVCDHTKQKRGYCRDYKFKAFCECDVSTTVAPTTLSTTIVPETETTASPLCPEGYIWRDCKIECNRLCMYYEHHLHDNEKCPQTDSCIAGCVLYERGEHLCPAGKYYRDDNTCVYKDDCTCITKTGLISKPGSITHESECEVCQCLHNSYICTDICTLPPTIITTPSASIVTEVPTENYTITETHVSKASSETQFTSELASTEITFTQTIIVPAITVTPPPPCQTKNYIPLDVLEYNATSSSGLNNGPDKAFIEIFENTLVNKNPWRAGVSNKEQYLQVNLGSRNAIYGLTLAGNPTNSEFVKSFTLLYSLDGVAYSYINSANGSHYVFEGPYSSYGTVKRIFPEPIEAQYIRINPIDWHKWISLQIEVLGCGPEEFSTTTTAPICAEPMGLESGYMLPTQIQVSSSLAKNFNPKDSSLSSSSAWIPFTSSPTQWIQFDLLGSQTISGLSTKGSTQLDNIGDAWVEQYEVAYSHDKINWNPVFRNAKHDKVFAANEDGVHIHTNFFSIPLTARYLRVYPVKWHNQPALKIEVLGCYEHITTILEETTTQQVSFVEKETTISAILSTTETIETTTQSVCVTCEGIPQPPLCPCSQGKFWNGEKCVAQAMCPCVIGMMKYEVGETYITEDCNKCTCTLGGVSDCKLQDCPSCPTGLQRNLTKTCSCVCSPCPEGTRLCDTSNICIDELLWCNGFQDCPDDENNCTTSTAIITTTEQSTTIKEIKPVSTCPEMTCPPGYEAVLLSSLSSKKGGVKGYGSSQKTILPSKLSNRANFETPEDKIDVTGVATGSYLDTLLSQAKAHSASSKGKKATKVYGYKGQKKEEQLISYSKKQEEQKQTLSVEECPSFRCDSVTSVCSKPKCPSGARLKTIWTQQKCPSYSCEVLPLFEKECDVDGRLFTTFDGLKYKHDICDHILAEDKYYKTWKIIKKHKCPYVGNCGSFLIIIHSSDTITLFQNFTTTFNGYKYTISQLQNIGSKLGSFVIRTVSNSYVTFTSSQFFFSVEWSSNGNVKIIVDYSLYGMVDGLCGYFDNNVKNDKTKPDGSLTSSTADFVASWKNEKSDICEVKVCPIEVQQKAALMCDAIKEAPLNTCEFSLNLEDHVGKCIESICFCAETSPDIDKCKCEALQKFVTTCSVVQQGIDLSTWRIKYDCAVNCTSPLVYQDCYNRECEPSCKSLLNSQECPRINEACYAGCYCPDGFVKEDNKCIKPTTCRDCVCEGNGVTEYTTFDKLDIPLERPCTSFVMLQTNNLYNKQSKPFTVILTNGPCTSDSIGQICQHGITVIIEDHVVLLMQSDNINEIIVEVDNHTISNFPYLYGPIQIKESAGISVTLSLVALELDVTFMTLNRGFSIKLPSNLYSGKIEGLCGSCDNIQENDILNADGSIPKTNEEFLNSWFTTQAEDTTTENCQEIAESNKTVPTCVPPKEGEENICSILEESKSFKQCHILVDVGKYIDQCKQDICYGQDESYCRSFEAYAKECEKAGLCLSWRTSNICPYTCPKDLVYEACSANCDLTCDNYLEIKADKSLCSGPLTEKCVCPEEKVMSSNGNCVHPSHCRPCDDLNHYAGDKWKQDNCTMCVCTMDGAQHCERKQCPPKTVCPRDYEAVLDENNDDICCKKYKCQHELKPSVTCPEVTQPKCGIYQELKMELTDENCTLYYCACIRKEDCPPIELLNDVELLPGMVKVEVKEDCCPSIIIECHNDTCPLPEKCPQFYVLSEIKNPSDCCPQYKCDPPKDKCIYRHEWTSSPKGGEKLRSEYEIYTETKEINETWSDGPCRQCTCADEITPRATCVSTQCPEKPESKDFVFKSVYHYETCCPAYEKVACKVDDVQYEPGSTWSVPGKPCLNQSCVSGTSKGELVLQETVQSCDENCRPGWEYVASNTSDICCGFCKQISCVDDQGIVHEPGEEWKSADNCTTYECEEKQLQLITYTSLCPNITGCPAEDIHKEECCDVCLPALPFKVCKPEEISKKDTNQLIRKSVHGHKNCFNKPISGFKHCIGQCKALEEFNDETARYGAACQCCVGIKYKKKKIEMQCEDGHTFYQTVEIPVDCSCEQCGGSESKLQKNFFSVPNSFNSSTETTFTRKSFI